MSRGGERLHRQDVADHLLAGRAQAPPGARLRAGLLRRAVPDRAARVRPARSSAARRRCRAATCGTTRTATACRSATTACTRRSRPTATGPGNTSQVTHLDDSRFGDHVDERYPGFNLDCSDHRDREPEWEREFSQYVSAFRADPSHDPLPALSIVRLPNDHTYGTTPGKAHPRGLLRRQRPRAGADGAGGLPQPVLAQHGDPGHRGRRPERARPRRRAPHARRT